MGGCKFLLVLWNASMASHVQPYKESEDSILRFPANIERSSLKTSMQLYCDVTSLCIFGALKG